MSRAGSAAVLGALTVCVALVAWGLEQQQQISALERRVHALESRDPAAGAARPPATAEALAPAPRPPSGATWGAGGPAPPDGAVRDEVRALVHEAVASEQAARRHRQTEAWTTAARAKAEVELADVAAAHGLDRDAQERVVEVLVEFWWLSADLKEEVASGQLDLVDAETGFQELEQATHRELRRIMGAAAFDDLMARYAK